MDTIKQVDKKLFHVSIVKQPDAKVKSFLGVEYDTLTLLSGFLVPFLSFILGFLFSILRDKLREKTEIKIASDSFIMWIEKLKKSANLLSEGIEEVIKSVEKLDGFQITKPANINLHLNRLTADQNLLYKAFVKSKKGNLKDNFNDYSKIMVDLDFLGDFQKMLSQNSQYVIEDFQNLFSDWNNNVRRLHKAKHNLVGKRAKDADAKIKSINEKFNEWFKTDDVGLSNTVDFLDKLEPNLQECYGADPSDDDVAELLSITQQIKTIYSQFIFQRDEVVKMFANMNKQLSDTISEISTLTKKIKNKKDKFFFT